MEYDIFLQHYVENCLALCGVGDGDWVLKNYIVEATFIDLLIHWDIGEWQLGQNSRIA